MNGQIEMDLRIRDWLYYCSEHCTSVECNDCVFADHYQGIDADVVKRSAAEIEAMIRRVFNRSV